MIERIDASLVVTMALKNLKDFEPPSQRILKLIISLPKEEKIMNNLQYNINIIIPVKVIVVGSYFKISFGLGWWRSGFSKLFQVGVWRERQKYSGVGG